jgi:hypothetical protein
MYVDRCSNPRRQKCDSKRSQEDFKIEIHRMCNIKTRIIPVIIGANGTISESFRKYVSTIPGNHKVRELKKTAILGTAHILPGSADVPYILESNAHPNLSQQACTVSSEISSRVSC